MGIKALVALKYFCVAYLVGPEVVGLVTLSLLVLGVLEEFTSTGLLPAGIQASKGLTRPQAGAWITVHFTRGLMIGLCVWAILPFMPLWSGGVEVSEYLKVAAFISVVKSLSSPGLVEANRQRKFGTLLFVELMPHFLDLAVSIYLLKSGWSGVAVILGVLLREFLRSLTSWVFFPFWARPNLQWQTLRALVDYGKWVWKTSILVVFLNQADKLLVSVLLGTYVLGLYQTASKIAQIMITDVPSAFGQYLLPVLSEQFQRDRQAFRLSCGRSFGYVACFVLVSVILIYSGLIDFLVGKLGKDWGGALELLRWLVIPMVVGAFQALAVTIAYALGVPNAVTRATQVQLFILCLGAPMGIYWMSVDGLIVSMAMAGFLSFVMILVLSRKAFYDR